MMGEMSIDSAQVLACGGANGCIVNAQLDQSEQPSVDSGFRIVAAVC